MAPSAGGVLAEWGADVLKVEHPRKAIQRGLRRQRHHRFGNTDECQFHQANRNKRSIGIDLSTSAGHELLMKIVAESDVFLTNFLPGVRGRLNIEVEDIRKYNADIIYARGSAVGPRGAQRDRGGYDYSTFWSRTGIAGALHTSELKYPPVMASGAMGDMATGAFLAGAISAALLKRERGGGGFVVDASLLATGVWLMALNVAAAAGGRPVYFHSQLDRSEPSNPLVNNFRTRDDRYISFCLLQPSWAWPELCERMGREDLLETNPRFRDFEGLQKYSRELTVILG